MEKQNDFYEVSEKSERSRFTRTYPRVCYVAIFTMRNHYKKVLRNYEEVKEYCDELTVAYGIGDEEIERLGDFVKILKYERCTMSFDYVTPLKTRGMLKMTIDNRKHFFQKRRTFDKQCSI